MEITEGTVMASAAESDRSSGAAAAQRGRLCALTVTDEFFGPELANVALEPLRAAGAEVELRAWEAADREAQRTQIRTIERGGPEAVPLPDALQRPVSHEVLLVQFCPLPRVVFDTADERLRIVVVNRAGVENVDLEAARERGVAVLNTPGRNARAVAEFTVGLILAETRNLARAHAHLKAGSWTRRFPNSGHVPELGDRTVGFVGYGRIARLVQRLLAGFGCRFLAYDPYVEAASLPSGCDLATLDELLTRADVVSLHARLTPDSRGLIGARELDLMKPTAILVNTARAELVVEEALVAALEAGRIAGAALDVFAEEPVPAGHPLITSPRTTVTPHLAGSSSDARLAGPRRIAEHFSRWLAGDTDLPVVNDVAAPVRP